jgi:hypothetical protein
MDKRTNIDLYLINIAMGISTSQELGSGTNEWDIWTAVYSIIMGKTALF